MERFFTRREFVAFLGTSGFLLHSPIANARLIASAAGTRSVRIAHLSDFHWGYSGEYNHHVEQSLVRALEGVRGLTPACDFLVVTGDLIEAASFQSERVRRLDAVKEHLDALRIPWMAVPGEHDTFGDMGRAFERRIGPLYFHRQLVDGIHVLGLDNVSRGYFVGRPQLHWLRRELRSLSPQDVLLVLSHAPLFTLFAPWNWSTFDGDAVYGALQAFPRRHFVFGHVHQSIDRRAHGMDNYAGLPTSWPYPEPGPLVPLKGWPQGASHPDIGLGFRVFDLAPGTCTESSHPLPESASRQVKPS